jgi:NADPH:quinone reductase-like Zn-dependent oxidoreductase
VNRADLLQRQGLYPPPPGASSILGLECAGEVIEIGGGVEGWALGDRAMALLSGGGYAEEVVVPAGCALRVPDRLGWEESAAVPEVFLTVFLNLFSSPDSTAADRARPRGRSGIGTAAIQLVKAAGGEIVVTAGSESASAAGSSAPIGSELPERGFVAEARGATGGWRGWCWIRSVLPTWSGISALRTGCLV